MGLGFLKTEKGENSEMGAVSPIFATDRTSAKLLDMSCREFRDLVDKGYLPKPILLGGEHERWKVSELERIASGEAAKPEISEDIEF